MMMMKNMSVIKRKLCVEKSKTCCVTCAREPDRIQACFFFNLLKTFMSEASDIASPLRRVIWQKGFESDKESLR